LIVFNVNDRVIVKNVAAFGPCPIFERYTLRFTLQLAESSIRIAEKGPGGQD